MHCVRKCQSGVHSHTRGPHRERHCTGRTAFMARHAAGPVTKQSEKAALEADGQEIVVVDTPGAANVCSHVALHRA